MTTHAICDACECVSHCSKNGCVPLTPIFRAPSVGCSGETASILEGWRIDPDEEGVRVVSPSGDGCYVWDNDSRNAPTFMGICQREVFRQLCQTLAAARAATGETS